MAVSFVKSLAYGTRLPRGDKEREQYVRMVSEDGFGLLALLQPRSSADARADRVAV